MRIIVQYVDKNGAILITETIQTAGEAPSMTQLEQEAKERLNSLNLSQRCASSIKKANVYTLLTSTSFE